MGFTEPVSRQVARHGFVIEEAVDLALALEAEPEPELAASTGGRPGSAAAAARTGLAGSSSSGGAGAISQPSPGDQCTSSRSGAPARRPRTALCCQPACGRASNRSTAYCCVSCPRGAGHTIYCECRVRGTSPAGRPAAELHALVPDFVPQDRYAALRLAGGYYGHLVLQSPAAQRHRLGLHFCGWMALEARLGLEPGSLYGRQGEHGERIHAVYSEAEARRLWAAPGRRWPPPWTPARRR